MSVSEKMFGSTTHIYISLSKTSGRKNTSPQLNPNSLLAAIVFMRTAQPHFVRTSCRLFFAKLYHTYYNVKKEKNIRKLNKRWAPKSFQFILNLGMQDSCRSLECCLSVRLIYVFVSSFYILYGHAHYYVVPY